MYSKCYLLNQVMLKQVHYWNSLLRIIYIYPHVYNYTCVMAYISVFIENIFTLFFQKQFPSLNAQYIYKLLSQGILCYIQNNLTAPNL